jgi:hypothetical protein
MGRIGPVRVQRQLGFRIGAGPGITPVSVFWLLSLNIH